MAEQDAMGDRRRAAEETYFQKKDRELIEKMRAAAASERARHEMSASTGLSDPEALHDLEELGFTPDTVALLPLVPIVRMAWIEGGVTPAERDKILDAGQREADRMIAEAEAEHHRLVSHNEVVVSADREATRLINEARAEAQRLRDEVDEYVDTTLANFEQFLTRSLASIERGRDKMHALREIGGFPADERDHQLPF